ncbi:MAG: hypothetical protein ARM1_0785 [Candidatus Micrarchaeota archaeon]|nr:MAG: hypothetical protein ARM1_0785 [Candidatus Micrarchaeota archaeon]
MRFAIRAVDNSIDKHILDLSQYSYIARDSYYAIPEDKIIIAYPEDSSVKYGIIILYDKDFMDLYNEVGAFIDRSKGVERVMRFRNFLLDYFAKKDYHSYELELTYDSIKIECSTISSIIEKRLADYRELDLLLAMLINYDKELNAHGFKARLYLGDIELVYKHNGRKLSQYNNRSWIAISNGLKDLSYSVSYYELIEQTKRQNSIQESSDIEIVHKPSIFTVLYPYLIENRNRD